MVAKAYGGLRESHGLLFPLERTVDRRAAPTAGSRSARPAATNAARVRAVASRPRSRPPRRRASRFPARSPRGRPRPASAARSPSPCRRIRSSLERWSRSATRCGRWHCSRCSIASNRAGCGARRFRRSASTSGFFGFRRASLADRPGALPRLLGVGARYRCCRSLFLIASVYYGIKTWNGDDVRVPVVSSWIEERYPQEDASAR